MGGEPQDRDREIAPTPGSRRGEHTDTYHGTAVADPYRWLEQDVRESAEVADWVARQNAFTRDYLAKLPERAAIARRLTELWNYERFGVPVRKGGRYFYLHNDGLQNQSVLCVQSALDAAPEVLIDPNTWADDGTVALAEVFPSPDGRYLAYLVQDGGSDWRSLRILDLGTRQLLPETLDWLKFSGIAWLPDGSGFYYSRYPEPQTGARFTSLNTHQAVWLHRPGTPQADDVPIYARPDFPAWGFAPAVSHDGRHLVISVSLGTDDRNQVVHQDLTVAGSRPEMLIAGFAAGYTFIGSRNDDLYFRTNAAAPNGCIVRLGGSAAAGRGSPRATVVVAERDDVLEGVSLVGGHLIAHYLRDASSAAVVFDLEGHPVREVPLPGIGTASGFTGAPDDSETFFSHQSFNDPGAIWRYDVASGAQHLFRRPAVAFDPADYVVEREFCASKDGTPVPVFITRRKDLPRDGGAPALLYGYGGFNIALTPEFSVPRLAWLERGGVYAVANLRGGGEYGETWHAAGTRLSKQNVFDDCIAAAEHLVARGYTTPGRLGIHGRSNGGLLVGAVLNQRPDLFGAAWPAVGVMDMLRFHHFTAGRFWVDDYGSADDPEEFRALLAYSPYHNIRSGVRYPAVLITTADTDDRVVPGHSFKYAARLQAAQAGGRPVLIRIDARAGHGLGTPTRKVIDDYADCWAFLTAHLR
jgi:prolyl oligopeptidase